VHSASRGHAQESLAILKLNSLNYDNYQAVKSTSIKPILTESLTEQELYTNVIEKIYNKEIDNFLKKFWNSSITHESKQ